MIFRRRRVRIEIEESTLTLRLATPLVSCLPTDTVVPPSPHSLLQPSPEAAATAGTEPKSCPEGTCHDI